MTGRRKLALAAALAAAAVLLCCGGVTFAAAGMFLGQQPLQPAAAGCTTEPGGQTARAGAGVRVVPVPGFSQDQVANAATIVRVGQQLGVPARGWVIAVATAMQESRLTNLGHLGKRNDHDSQGLFQQRPSQGWGTVDQIRDPEYAAGKFYTALVKVPGWAGLPLTRAAQRVQRSAFPSAYAKHEAGATRLVNAVTGGAANSGRDPIKCAEPGEVTAGGWVRPVPGGIVSQFRSASRPGHNGVDLAAPKRTVIRAAASGTVIRSLCDTGTLDTVGSCDRDGSPSARGCGWYVDLAHAGGIITRYCHMIVRPLVAVGQHVAAGQQIGWSGTSGRSSGPHLHFEVHTNGDRSSRGAVNPVPFMAARGARLGK